MYFNLLFIVISISPIQHTAHEKFKRKPTSLMVNFKIPINKPVCSNDDEGIFLWGYFFYRITVPKEWREKLGRGYSHHILARRPTMAVSIVCSYNLLSFWTPVPRGLPRINTANWLFYNSKDQCCPKCKRKINRSAHVCEQKSQTANQ